jgi:hypothetical protein
MSLSRRAAALVVLSLAPACGGGGDTDPEPQVCAPFDEVGGRPTGLAVDATRVYWTDLGATSGKGAVYSAPKDCGAKTKIAGDQNDPVALAVDAASVYWLNHDAVMKAPLGGGSAVKLCDVTDDAVDGDVVLGGDHVYVATGQRILRVPKAGGSAEDLAFTTSAWALALDADYVYASEQGGGVLRVPRAGGSAETIAPAQYGLGVAASADTVYWLALGGFSEGRILGMPKAGGDGLHLGDARSDSRLLLDGDRLYASSAGDLLSIDVHTGAAERLTAGHYDVPTRFVADDDRVYWVAVDQASESDVPTSAVRRHVKPTGGAPVFTKGSGSLAAAWTVDREKQCRPGAQVSLVLSGPTPAAFLAPCDAFAHTFTGLGPGSYTLTFLMLGGSASIGFDMNAFTVGSGLHTLPVVDLGECTLTPCAKAPVGCVDDGVCTAEDDCTCPDCAADFVCNPGASACPADGVCTAYYEGCSCPDCAATPACM